MNPYTIDTDGTMTAALPANGTDFELKQLQAIVGGPIEIVRLPRNQIMVINEEGKIISLPTNEAASHIAWLSGSVASWDVICGKVLVCESCQVR